MKRYFVYEDGTPRAPMHTVYAEDKRGALKEFSKMMGVEYKFIAKYGPHTHCLVLDSDYRNYNFSKFSHIMPK